MKFLIWLFHIVTSFIIILILDLVLHIVSNQVYTTGYIIKCAIFGVACASAVRTCKKYDRRQAAREKSGNSSEVKKVKSTYTSNSFVINDFIDKIEESSIRRNEIHDNINPAGPNFGYCKTNPIGTSSVENSEKYLSLLRSKEGKKFFWMRKESVCVESFGNVDNVMVDVYHLYLDGLFTKMFIYVRTVMIQQMSLVILFLPKKTNESLWEVFLLKLNRKTFQSSNF